MEEERRWAAQPSASSRQSAARESFPTAILALTAGELPAKRRVSVAVKARATNLAAHSLPMSVSVAMGLDVSASPHHAVHAAVASKQSPTKRRALTTITCDQHSSLWAIKADHGASTLIKAAQRSSKLIDAHQSSTIIRAHRAASKRFNAM